MSHMLISLIGFVVVLFASFVFYFILHFFILYFYSQSPLKALNTIFINCLYFYILLYNLIQSISDMQLDLLPFIVDLIFTFMFYFISLFFFQTRIPFEYTIQPFLLVFLSFILKQSQ